MAFNGFGTFTRLYTWVTDKANTVKITASRMDAEFDGIATGLSNCITKDGQTTLTADIPFSSRKLTGLGDAAADTDAANRQTVDARIQLRNANWLTSVSGADTITASASPALTAYTTGQTFTFKAAGTSTGAVTLNIDSVGATAVKQPDGTAIEAGDLTSGYVYTVTYDGTNFLLHGVDYDVSVATDQIEDDAVTTAKIADDAVTSAKLADNIAIAETLQIGGDQAEFRYRTGGNTDTNWKNIADITCGTGTYQAATFDVTVLNPDTNNGHTTTAKRFFYTVAAVRSQAVEDDTDTGEVAGPENEYVRLVKTSTGVYELQVRQPANYKEVTFVVRCTAAGTSNTSYIYNQSPSNGSSGPDVYTVGTPDPFHGFNQIEDEIITSSNDQLCKAWIQFDGTGTIAIADSYGVDSITDNGTGNYTVTLTTAMSDTNYCAVAGVRGDGTDGQRSVMAKVTSTTEILITVDRSDNGSDKDVDQVHLAIFGN